VWSGARKIKDTDNFLCHGRLTSHKHLIERNDCIQFSALNYDNWPILIPYLPNNNKMLLFSWFSIAFHKWEYQTEIKLFSELVTNTNFKRTYVLLKSADKLTFKELYSIESTLLLFHSTTTSGVKKFFYDFAINEIWICKVAERFLFSRHTFSLLRNSASSDT
jgi:hypothetical protein